MLSDKETEIINDAYMSAMAKKATPEQELIWKLSNALVCIKVWYRYSDKDHNQKIVDLLNSVT